MTNNSQKTRGVKKSGFGPVAAAVAGVVVGAGVAVAGAVVMADEKNRKKAKQLLKNAKAQTVGYVNDLKMQAENKKSQVVKELVDNKEDIKNTITEEVKKI